MATVYEVNKGVNKPLEFKGLKAQYIVYLAVGLVLLLILFAVGYISGVPVYICIAVVMGAGTLLVNRVYALSRKYGQYGLLKAAGYRQVPVCLRCRSRRCFLLLKKPAGAAGD